MTKHDVKARLEEFAELSGHQHAHKGMTSRDLTENVEQLQTHRALSLILEKSVACLIAISEKAAEFKDLAVTASSHNVPAQLTTLGKRMANWGKKWNAAWRSFETLCHISLSWIKRGSGYSFGSGHLIGQFQESGTT